MQMGKRFCEYCKFEIPYDATVCGHCGKGNYWRSEMTTCYKCNTHYQTRVAVEGGKIIENCPHCREAKENKFRTKWEKFVPLKDKMEDLDGQMGSLLDTLKRSEPGLLLIQPFVLLIPSGIISALLDIAYIFWLSYLGLCFFFIVIPFFRYIELKIEISSKRKEIELMADEINKKGYGEWLSRSYKGDNRYRCSSEWVAAQRQQ